MNILQRKMRVKNNHPSSFNSLSDLFIDMNEQAVTYLEDKLAFEIDPKHVRQAPEFLDSNCFDACVADLTGLLFAIGGKAKGVANKAKGVANKAKGVVNDEQFDCQMLLEISPGLARAIIAAKLGRETSGTTSKTDALTLFDVLLLQSLAERVLSQLQILTAEPALEIMGRSTVMDGLNGVHFAKQADWLKLHFPIVLKTNQSSAKNTKKKGDKKPTNPLGISLYLTHEIAQNILQVAQKKQSLKIIDPDNPWSQHMNTTMLSASRSLEIVIEDLKLSIAECTRFELGQIIALPGASHERLNIKTKSGQGKAILTTATLGVFKSSKAVKLNEDIDPDFLGDISC